MIKLEHLIEQVRAKPFVPFTLILSNGDRCEVISKEHVSLPPLTETGEHTGWIVVYGRRSAWPRYLSLESVAALQHDLP